MGLRNAFEGVATESTLKRLLNLLNFARDPADRLRVRVDEGVVTTVSAVSTLSTLSQISWGASNVAPIPWSNGAPNSMDMREMAREASRTVLNQRRERWTF